MISFFTPEMLAGVARVEKLTLWSLPLSRHGAANHAVIA
jgi:hypothetical protein